MLRATIKGSGLLRLGAITTVSANPLDVGSNWETSLLNPTLPLVSYDPLFSVFLNAEAISSPVDFYSIAGGSAEKDSILFLYGNTPAKVVPDGIGVLGNFVNYVNNVRALFTDWDFSKDVIVPHENPVVHSSLRGIVLAGQRESSLLRATDAYTAGEVPYTGIVVDESPEGIWSWTPDSGALDFASRTFQGNVWGLLTAFPLIADEEYTANTPFDTTYGYTGLHVLSDDGISVTSMIYDHISATHHISGDPYRFLNFKRTRFRVDFQFQALPEFYPGNGVSGTLSDYWRCSVVIGAAVMESWNRPDHDTPPDYVVSRDFSDDVGIEHYDVVLTPIVANTVVASAATSSGFTDFIGYRDGNLFSGGSGEKTYSSFYHWSHSNVAECYAGNYLASVDAIDKQFVTMKANHVEFLVELRDLVSPLDLAKSLYYLARFKGSKVRAIARLVALLCDAKLLYSFAIAPTTSDAKDVAKKARGLLRKYRTLLTENAVTLHGVSRYETTEDDSQSFIGTFVECRSKIRVSLEPDSLLPYILPARSLGLLPSLSTLWDLIPFSFVVDWFTNVGSTTRAVEDQLLLLALHTETSVNSVMMMYRFTDEDWSAYDFWADESSGILAGYRYYSRYLLTGIPVMVPTRWGFYGNTWKPDFGLIGALLYKLL